MDPAGPGGYVNGPDVYQLERSNPASLVDPLGLATVGYAVARTILPQNEFSLTWTQVGVSLAISGIAWDAAKIYDFLDGANQLDETVASIDLQEMKILAMQRRNQELRRRLAESGGKTPDGQRGEQCATGPLASESEKKTAPPTTQAATTQASGNAAEKGVNPLAEDAADYANANNGAARPGYRGGSNFANDGRGGGQVLPSTDSAGNPITYKEYDTNPYQAGTNRGPERVVIGSDGSAYFTSDHYTTFTKFR